MKIARFRPFNGNSALRFTLLLSAVCATSWLVGCSGGSSGSGLSLGNGLPTGGGGGPSGGGGGGGNGGGGGGGGGTIATATPEPACGGGGLSASFSTAVGANADTTVFSATKVRGTAVNAGASGSSFTLAGTLCNPPASGNRAITIKVSHPLTAGATYALASGSSGSNFLQYFESTVNGSETVEKSWTATAASLKVLSVTGQSVTFQIQNATLAPDPDFFTSNATGTFHLNVTGTVTVVSGL